jgi:hypothetical protein
MASCCGDVGLIARIQELYLLVHQKTEVTNNSIFVSFTPSLLAERKTFKVIWARFVEQVQTMSARGHKTRSQLEGGISKQSRLEHSTILMVSRGTIMSKDY